jgi:hypothetical protein
MHRNEVFVNPVLPSLVPRLRWTVERSGWLALGFDYVDGRHANLSPGSPDVDAVVATVAHLQTALTPAPTMSVGTFAERWRGRIAPALVAGHTLLHTDLSRRNFLVRDGVAHLVDWAGPALGAGWIDAAFLVVRLIRYGHAPALAEARVADLASWRAANPAALAAWASALIGLWSDRQRTVPAQHRVGLLAAARRWAAYRAEHT